MSYEQQAVYYGTRRKRNIQMRPDWNNSNNSTGINWAKPRETTESEYDYDDHDEQEYSKDVYEQESFENNQNREDSYDEIKATTIGKKAASLEKLKTKLQPAETEKITIYLDKDLLDILKILKKEKRISSYSKAIKNALEEYLGA